VPLHPRSNTLSTGSDARGRSSGREGKVESVLVGNLGGEKATPGLQDKRDLKPTVAPVLLTCTLHT